MSAVGISRSDPASGKSELRSVQTRSRGLFLAAVLFSVFINLLMLTGPLYMLQVYDRVLGSRSEPTLIALSVLVMFLFLAMGFLDHVRSRVLTRIGLRTQTLLDKRVFEAALARSAAAPDDPLAISAQRDLIAVSQYWTSPISSALMDLPWTPIFLAAIFVFHPTLGWLAIAGGAVLVGLAILNQSKSKTGRCRRAGPMPRGDACPRSQPICR